jgi:hypothetical protein
MVDWKRWLGWGHHAHQLYEVGHTAHQINAARKLVNPTFWRSPKGVGLKGFGGLALTSAYFEANKHLAETLERQKYFRSILELSFPKAHQFVPIFRNRFYYDASLLRDDIITARRESRC